MPVAYQMPLSLGTATKVGPRMWRKTILRTGHISKGGIELDVDRALMDTYVQNFRAGAKDQVQFLAGHNEDNLEAFRGDLVGLEITDDDRLVGMFSVTDKADQMLEENPRLGTSPSLVDRFERADGREYGPTLLHVAATFDPEVSQLGDWVRAELSATKTQVIDLSGPDEAPPSSHDSANPGGDAPEGDPVAQLTDEQINKLLKLLEGNGGSDTAAADKTDKDDGDEPEFTEAELAAMADPAVEDKPAPDVKAEDKTPELVNASHETNEQLELANARIDAQSVELAAMRRERDEERYKAEQLDLARNFGIPADVTELARPLLFGTGRTLELSAGKKVDAGQVMRKVLHELGRRYAKALDLGAEYGTADAQDDATKRQSELDEFINRARTEMGLSPKGDATNA